jgi:hypothetical protein
MAAFDGVSVLAPDIPDLDFTALAISGWTADLPLDTDPDDSTPVMVGTWNDLFPLEMPEEQHDGVFVPSYLQDYYYRFWVIPPSFNEFILTEFSSSFAIWNAFLEPTECTDYDVTEADEIEFSLESGEPPFTIWTLRTRTFPFVIPVAGSPEFTSIIAFIFPGFGEPDISIHGIRVKVFAWPPLLPVTESLEWLTDIIRARDGSEQRICLRPAPRQGFRFGLYLKNEAEQSKFDVILWRHQKRTWGLPVWPEWTLHASTISIGATTISFDTTTADYRAGGLAIIWQSEESYEIVKIDSVAAGSLTLESGVAATWTGDKHIMPLRIAYLRAQVSRPSAPDGYAKATLDFTVRDNVRLTGYANADPYNGSEVLPATIVDEGDQEIESDGDASFVDYGFGEFEIFSDSEFNIVVQSHIFRKEGRAECWNFRKFWHSVFGRRNIVWIPTYKADITQLNQIGPGATSFNVANVGLALNMGTNEMRKHIAFIFPDGTALYREIMGITEVDADTETITIDSALGVTVNPGDCEISWLDRCRLTDDKVEWAWEDFESLRCKTNFTRISQ